MSSVTRRVEHAHVEREQAVHVLGKEGDGMHAIDELSGAPRVAFPVVVHRLILLWRWAPPRRQALRTVTHCVPRVISIARAPTGARHGAHVLDQFGRLVDPEVHTQHRDRVQREPVEVVVAGPVLTRLVVHGDDGSPLGAESLPDGVGRGVERDPRLVASRRGGDALRHVRRGVLRWEVARRE